MASTTPERWEIYADGDVVEVHRDGRWFADAEDINDAIGILQGQRVRRYLLVTDGRPDGEHSL